MQFLEDSLPDRHSLESYTGSLTGTTKDRVCLGINTFRDIVFHIW